MDGQGGNPRPFFYAQSGIDELLTLITDGTTGHEIPANPSGLTVDVLHDSKNVMSKARIVHGV